MTPYIKYLLLLVCPIWRTSFQTAYLLCDLLFLPALILFSEWSKKKVDAYRKTKSLSKED